MDPPPSREESEPEPEPGSRPRPDADDPETFPPERDGPEASRPESSSGASPPPPPPPLRQQLMGACRADERLRPLVTLNVSCTAADDRLVAHLAQHFEVSEVGLLARCLCVPLVSLRVGKVQRDGTLLCPTPIRIVCPGSKLDCGYSCAAQHFRLSRQRRRLQGSIICILQGGGHRSASCHLKDFCSCSWNFVLQVICGSARSIISRMQMG